MRIRDLHRAGIPATAESLHLPADRSFPQLRTQLLFGRTTVSDVPETTDVGSTECFRVTPTHPGHWFHGFLYPSVLCFMEDRLQDIGGQSIGCCGYTVLILHGNNRCWSEGAVSRQLIAAPVPNTELISVARPVFIVIGAAKSLTSSLCVSLQYYPLIHISAQKEFNCF